MSDVKPPLFEAVRTLEQVQTFFSMTENENPINEVPQNEETPQVEPTVDETPAAVAEEVKEETPAVEEAPVAVAEAV